MLLLQKLKMRKIQKQFNPLVERFAKKYSDIYYINIEAINELENLLEVLKDKKIRYNKKYVIEDLEDIIKDLKRSYDYE